MKKPRMLGTPSGVFDVTATREMLARTSYTDEHGQVRWATGTLFCHAAVDGKALVRDPSIIVRLDHGEGKGRDSQIEFPPEAAEAMAVLFAGLVKAARQFGTLPPLEG